MARYDITHACGHSTAHQIYGGNARREEQAGWEARRPCPECRAAHAHQRDTTAATQIRQADENDGLPELSGTDRQIPWGTRVRRERLEQVRDYLETTLGGQGAERVWPLVLRLARHQGEAGWWIDHRRATGPAVWEALLVGAGEAEAEQVLEQAERACREEARP
ncbi:hypothetical protein ACQEU5_24820 [Marinactinospora thermotolerans]|uniref:hypothetical protein n=1 Tax=Marinactinospora thermotolerans TaxID=531310 RepID=UPI003D938B54